MRCKYTSVGVASLLSLILSLPVIAQASDLGDEDIEAQVHRNGTQLEVRWKGRSALRWKLSQPGQGVCAEGVVEPGRGQLNLSKVPLNLNLNLEIGGRRYGIPARDERSRLERVASGAVIYQLPIRTWAARGEGRSTSGRLRDLTDEVFQEIQQLGADYVWLTGVLENADPRYQDPDVVKGTAGSYYAITDMWDVSPQIGDLEDLRATIARAHRNGLRVLLDFIPNHTARIHQTDVTCKNLIEFGKNDRTDHFFNIENNYFYLGGTTFTPPASGRPGADGVYDMDLATPGIQYESPARVTGNNIPSAHPQASDWYDVAKLNFGYEFSTGYTDYSRTPRTWKQMADIAKHWLALGVDGFRADFSQAVPVEFWRYFVREVRAYQPNTYLVAEAYEGSSSMAVNGFTYEELFRVGFDSVYNAAFYWRMRELGRHPGNMRHSHPLTSPIGRSSTQHEGWQYTQYIENHDELRITSHEFAPGIGTRGARAELGLAFSAYMTLLPGHFLLHGGQEFQEPGSPGYEGKTSIFDFIHQPWTRLGMSSKAPSWLRSFRDQYASLFNLKKNPAFKVGHKNSRASYIDLLSANHSKAEFSTVSAYVRWYGKERFLVVLNSDPHRSRHVTVHLTAKDHQDTTGALAALGIENSSRPVRFTEVWSRPGWTPPGVSDSTGVIPGWVLYRSQGVPSGLYLGEMPPATTWVFQIED